MNENPTTIIALFGRGREIGFVLLEKGEVIRYGVKTIKGKRKGPAFARRVEKALSPLLEMSEPHGVVVVERISSLGKGALCRVIQTLAKSRRNQGYQVRSVSWEDVKEKLCGRRKATQQEVMQVLVKRHQLLWPLITRSRTHQEKYWRNVLLAAALADAVQRK